MFPNNKNQNKEEDDQTKKNCEILGDVEVTVDPSLDENYMTSVVYHNHQSIESIEFDQYTALPIPARGELLIKVLAFGINPIDVKCLENNISQSVIPLPKTLGCEFSGRVTSTTTCYTNYFQVGDNVVGMLPLVWTQKGAAAEYITVNENLCAKVPHNISAIETAGIPVAGLTVVQALKEFLHENSFPGSTTGKRILIQGASGGIGTFSIQYCKNVLGMYVIATCSEGNIPFIRSLGADEIIDHEHARFEDLVRDCDVILDSRSYLYEKRTLHSKELVLKKPGGRYINISSSDNRGNPIKRNHLTLTNPDLKISRIIKTSLKYSCHNFLRFCGEITHVQSLANEPIYELFVSVRPDGQMLRYIMSLIGQRFIRPVVSKVYLTNEVKDALYHVESGNARGKVIVMGIPTSRKRKSCLYSDLERDGGLVSPSIFQYGEEFDGT